MHVCKVSLYTEAVFGCTTPYRTVLQCMSVSSMQMILLVTKKLIKHVFFEAGKDSCNERKNKYVLIFPTYSSEKNW